MSKAADDKERLARTFERLASEASHVLTRLSKNAVDNGLGGVGRGGREVWSGPAAGRFLQQMQQSKGELGKLPEGFRQTARNLRESAKELRAAERAQEKAQEKARERARERAQH